MSNYIYSENLVKYFQQVINDEFAQLTPDQMITRLVDGLSSLKTTPEDIRMVYTSRDAQGIRSYLISLIEQLTDDWTDFNESDIGVALIELIAGMADMLGFYLDKQALECYIGSVKQRKNGAALLKLINYNLHLTSSSRTTGRFTLYQNYSENIIIPKYTQVSATLADKSKVLYATAEEVIIPAGEVEVDIPLIQGEVHNSSVKVADLLNNQKVKFSTDNVADGSMIVTIDGLEWTQIPDVVIDDEPGTKYSVYEDKDCKAYVLFHNSYKNYLPEDKNQLASFQFLVSAGKAGQIKEGLISVVESPIYFQGQDISKTIEVTNLDASSGGSDRETLDEARTQAPKTLSMLGKVITLSDFEDMGTEIQGVLKCKAIDWSVDGNYVTEPYFINLYIVPTDGYTLSSAQSQQITDYFKGRTVNYQQLRAMEARYIDLDLEVIVNAYVSESNKDYLQEKVKKSLLEGLSPANLNFGEPLYISDIKSMIRSSDDSISSADISNMTDNIYPRLNEFIRVGNIHVTVNSQKVTRERI